MTGDDDARSTTRPHQRFHLGSSRARSRYSRVTCGRLVLKKKGLVWAHQDSNLEPADYEPAALTVELWARKEFRIWDSEFGIRERNLEFVIRFWNPLKPIANSKFQIPISKFYDVRPSRNARSLRLR